MALLSQWKASFSATTASLASTAASVGQASAVHVNVTVKLLFQVRICYITFVSFLLGTFAKLIKETVSFVMFVCLSVCPHGTTRLPFDGI